MEEHTIRHMTEIIEEAALGCAVDSGDTTGSDVEGAGGTNFDLKFGGAPELRARLGYKYREGVYRHEEDFVMRWELIICSLEDPDIFGVSSKSIYEDRALTKDELRPLFEEAFKMVMRCVLPG